MRNLGLSTKAALGHVSSPLNFFGISKNLALDHLIPACPAGRLNPSPKGEGQRSF